MTVVELFAKPKPNDRHYYAYDAVLAGELVVSGSRDPEHDLARALLSRGLKGFVQIVDGKTGRPRSKVDIRKAAKLCVGSNLEVFKWKPAKASDSGAHAGEQHQPRSGVGPDRFGAPCSVVGFPQKSSTGRSVGDKAA